MSAARKEQRLSVSGAAGCSRGWGACEECAYFCYSSPTSPPVPSLAVLVAASSLCSCMLETLAETPKEHPLQRHVLPLGLIGWVARVCVCRGGGGHVLPLGLIGWVACVCMGRVRD